MACFLVDNKPEGQEIELLVRYQPSVKGDGNKPRLVGLHEILNSGNPASGGEISPEAVLRGYQKFASYIFADEQAANDELRCTYYLRMPLFVSIRNRIVSEVFFAFKELPCHRTRILLDRIRYGVKLTSSLVTGKVAYHILEHSDDNLEHLLWPQTIMNDWFSQNGRIIAHNFRDHPPSRHNGEQAGGILSHDGVREAFRDYLRNLFQFDPPDHWFDDQEQEGQTALAILFESLKNFTGHECNANNNRNHHNLDLNGVFLLLAAACGKQLDQHTQSIHLVANSRIILPIQSGEQSRQSIMALLKFFRALSFHKKGGGLAVEKSSLTAEKIKITFDLDPKTKESDRDNSLLEKINQQIATGDVCKNFFDFQRCSVIRNDGSRHTKCALDLKEKNGKTVLEIKAC
jgi:hypothetical protein